MKRIGEFLRSVLPADPTQLLFVAGVVCFVIGPRLRWLPQKLAGTSERLTPSLALFLPIFSICCFFLIVTGGVTGYFVCFWPGKQPLRRVLLWVWSPAAAGTALMFARLIYLGAPASSVLESSRRAIADKIVWAWSLPWRTLSALHICVLGLLLIGIFCFRLASQKTSLPLRLPSTGATADSEDGEFWERTKILIWIVVGPLILVYGILGGALAFLPRVLYYIQSSWFLPAAMGVMGSVMVGITLYMLPAPALGVLRDSIRWPSEKYILLAFALPVFVALFLAVGHYAVERAYWTANEFRSYFSFDDSSLLFLLVLLFSAFTEEVVFRGVLQSTLIRRFGMYRGIFLLGIVWSAFHFPFDFSGTHLADLGVLQAFFSRLFNCVALGFVLSWLTLGAGSIAPAAIAHALYNLSIYTDFAPAFPGKDIVRSALWAVLASVLFRYWPATLNEEPVVDSSGSSQEITPQGSIDTRVS